MQRTLVVGGLLAIGCLFLAAGPTQARADDGWSLPKPKLPKPKLPELKMPELKLPQLPSLGVIVPGSSKVRHPHRSARQPSTLDKLNAGTKNFFTKTKETLTPWKKPTPPPTLTPPTGVRRTTRSAQPAKKKSSLASFFKRLDEPDPPRRPMAPHDFIGQPRPDF